jgi:predicted glutamine amidotransferase
MCRWLAYSGSPILLDERSCSTSHSPSGSRAILWARSSGWSASSEELEALSDETRVVVSEPLGDKPGAWNEVPEAHVGIVQPGEDELVPFSPSVP